MDKIYAYVDESGQETLGRIFVVAVIILKTDSDSVRDYCEKVEVLSGKGKFKWGKA